MNSTIRNTLKSTYKKLSNCFNLSISGFISIIRVFVLSRIGAACKSSRFCRNNSKNANKECTILANGPSLKNDLENDRVRLEQCDVFCVNMFVQSEFFWKIKPRYYFLVDGAFFNPESDRLFKLVETLSDCLNRVDWDIYVCISSTCVNGGILKKINNQHVKFVRWNTTSVEGPSWFVSLLCKFHLGMPPCINVVNFALISAINMGYKKINLYGVDHSWTRNYYVDENNVFCSKEEHVYGEPTIIKLPKTTLVKELSSAVLAFKIHFVINKYALHRGTKIVNCTKGSFIEAYERE